MKRNKQNINALPEKEFNDLAWANMLETLDQEMPQEKERKKFAFWIWPLAALLFIGVGLFALRTSEHNSGDEPSLRTASYEFPAVESTDKPVGVEPERAANSATPNGNGKTTDPFDEWSLPSSKKKEASTKEPKQKETAPKAVTIQANEALNNIPNLLEKGRGIPQKQHSPTDIQRANFEEKPSSTLDPPHPTNDAAKGYFPTKEIAKKAVFPVMEREFKPGDPLPEKYKYDRLKWGMQARLFGGILFGKAYEAGGSVGFSLQKKRWGLKNEIAVGLRPSSVISVDTIYDASFCGPSLSCNYTVEEKRGQISAFVRSSLFTTYALNSYLELYAGPDFMWQKYTTEKTNTYYENDSLVDTVRSKDDNNNVGNNLGGNLGLRFTPNFPIGFDLRYRQGYNFPKVQGVNLGNRKMQLSHLIELGVVIRLK